MSNLNARNTNRSVRPKVTVNHEGEKSYTLNAKENLVTLASTSLVNDKFYETKGEGIANLVDAIVRLRTSDPEFVLKVAAYARNVLNMRSLPQIMLVECANRVEFKPYISKWAPLIMLRADEPTDVLAYQISKFGRSSKGGSPIPNSLKRAIKKKLETFSKYQLAKYQGKGSSVKLADVIKLTHPNLGEFGKSIIEGTAKADTWETKLSASGGVDKSKAWEEAIPTMGYMALLRNLRNFIAEGISLPLFKNVLDTLSDKERVKKSRQFPFRFYSAYVELYNARYALSSAKNEKMINLAMDALAIAMDHAVDNVNIEGKNLFLVDSSGSMFQPVSKNSSVQAIDVACLLGCIGVKRSDSSRLWTFDSVVTEKNPRRTTPILDMSKTLKNSCRGGATYFDKAMSKILSEGTVYDNIIVVSDMQVYSSGWNYSGNPQSLWKRYLATAPNAKLHVIDSVGYNKGTPFKKDANNVHIYSGWSEKILEMIGSPSSAGLVEEIEEWNPFVQNED